MQVMQDVKVNNSEWMTATQGASRLGVSSSYIYRLVTSSLLPSRKVGWRRLVHRPTIEKMARHKVEVAQTVIDELTQSTGDGL